MRALMGDEALVYAKVQVDGAFQHFGNPEFERRVCARASLMEMWRADAGTLTMPFEHFLTPETTQALHDVCAALYSELARVGFAAGRLTRATDPIHASLGAGPWPRKHLVVLLCADGGRLPATVEAHRAVYHGGRLTFSLYRFHPYRSAGGGAPPLPLTLPSFLNLPAAATAPPAPPAPLHPASTTPPISPTMSPLSTYGQLDVGGCVLDPPMDNELESLLLGLDV